MSTVKSLESNQGSEPEFPRAKPGIARRILREFLVICAFCAFTVILTWPYINYLRDAVADKGDPYLVSWILWWDYHQTFTNPLSLFHANVFYPYHYTLAFSEHCYGLSLLFFPLFALGFRPLTVHAVAIFFGWVLSGYGAFRLARTLTGCLGVAWIAGIIFAFVPYRFQILSQLPYEFCAWIPLLFEALVLFARERSGKRAAWLGFVFFMNGLASVTWFVLSLVPLALVAAVLLTRYQLWRDHKFWRRSTAAVGVASLGLLPFMVPYYIVSRLYGFTRTIEEIQGNSAWPIQWLSGGDRNKLWHRMGEGIAGTWQFKLFPGLLPILLSVAAVILPHASKGPSRSVRNTAGRTIWVKRLDVAIFLGVAISILAIGFDGTAYYRGLFRHITSERALTFLYTAVITRLCLAYPAFMRVDNENFVQTLRSEKRGDAFWLGVSLTVVGFCYSLGWNFFFYRICYDLIPVFRSMRMPTRGAMFAYLGLALLAGLGARRIAELVAQRRPRVRPAVIYVCACTLLLLELNAAPLRILRGDVFPDAVTLRLKETPMRGGIVVLPAGSEYNYHHMLRAADHAKPLIVGTSGFVPPIELEIEELTRVGAINPQFLDLLEAIPASYLVVETDLIVPERRTVFETFLARAVAHDRLRFVKRFDGHDDLYAITKTEPQARSEEALPFGPSTREWATLVADDPVNMLGQYQSWSQKLFRLSVASYGGLPRYAEFLHDVKEIGHEVVPGYEENDSKAADNFRKFLDAWIHRPAFVAAFDRLTDQQFVNRLYENAGLRSESGDRDALAGELTSGHETRAGILLKVVENPRFIEREDSRSLVVLHFFGYLRRNPDDPPDNDLRGMWHWIQDLERTHDRTRLAIAFRDSFERARLEHK